MREADQLRFDDRLSTVLGLTAEAPRDRAVQWRQLVELVARGAGATDPVLLASALARIAEIGPEVPEGVRTAAARAIAAPTIPLPLLLLFAADCAEVAAPLLGSIELEEAGWGDLWRGASLEVRSLIDTLHPSAAAKAEPVPKAGEPPAVTVPQSAPLFRWECGPEGAIEWVEGISRAAVIGHSVRADLKQRFDAMQPFADELLVLADAGALAGDWRWSGQPQFAPGTGRFAGYSGVASRIDAPARGAAPTLASSLPLDHDSLRELIHELRTPLTAIIGFGEVIEGQYLGPAHRAYRDRASEIVRQARLLLAAVDDLDLAAKLRSNRSPAEEGASLAAVALTLANRVRVKLRDDEVRCALELGLAERLLRRFVVAMADAAPEGERLQLVIDQVNGTALLAIERPEATLGLSEEQLLGGGSAGNLGFALRLVRGLAQIVGGSLDVEPEFVVLLLPAV